MSPSTCPYTSDTKDFINGDAIAKMKGGVRILNLARGEPGERRRHDRRPGDRPGGQVCHRFPQRHHRHGARTSSPCPIWAPPPRRARRTAPSWPPSQLQDYLVNGNIRNSVNLPNLEQEWSGISRLCLIHRNVPAMLTNIMSTLSNDGINVENMTNKSKKDYAYTIVDVNTRITDQVANELRAIPGVIRVRVLNH